MSTSAKTVQVAACRTKQNMSMVEPAKVGVTVRKHPSTLPGNYAMELPHRSHMLQTAATRRPSPVRGGGGWKGCLNSMCTSPTCIWDARGRKLVFT